MKKLLAMLLLFGALGAQAVEKEINILVPNPPGASVDKYVRAIHIQLQEKLNTTVNIKYMPGAGGRVAIAHLQSNPHEFNVIISTNDILYDLVDRGEQDQFLLSNVVGESPQFLWGHPSGGVERFKQQIKNKESISIGVLGVKGTQEAWVRTLKIDNPNFIPYKGGVPMAIDVAGGHTDYTTLTFITAHELYSAGKMIPIFVGSDRRHPLLPFVPTQKELNLTTPATTTVTSETLVYASNNADPATLKKFSDAVKEVTATAPGMQSLKDYGMIVLNQSGAEAEKHRQTSIKLYNKMQQK